MDLQNNSSKRTKDENFRNYSSNTTWNLNNTYKSNEETDNS